MKKRFMIILALTFTMVLGLSLTANAESKQVTGNCYFNGKDVVCDFDSNIVAETISGLEPGDDVTFRIRFQNKYDDTTQWYMRNEALKTLEQSYDRTQNGGYTYKLKHITPGGKEETLFDNSQVGGEYTMPTDGSKTTHGTENTGEGLHQATNAADEWFFVQTLEKNQSAYTEMYVKFDGETEVNDYMDTNGLLLVAYAVELSDSHMPGVKYDDEGRIITSSLEKAGYYTKGNGSSKTGGSRTGDTQHLLTYIATMLGSLLLLILTVMSFRKDRRMSRAEAAAGITGAESEGKERD